MNAIKFAAKAAVSATACVAAILAVQPSSAASEEPTKPVEIRFAAEIDGSPFSCAQAYEGIGVTQSTVEIADFRVFVTNLRLLAADGTETPLALEQDGKWQYENVALLDFSDGTGTCVNGTPQINTRVHGTAPEGDYTGLAFDIGVPFSLNHNDPTLAASPLNLTAMFWNWQGGYKFINLDMATAGMPIETVQTTGDHAGGSADERPRARGWSLHLGSTGCASESRTTPPVEACANPNHVSVKFAEFDPTSNMVVFDPAPVLAEADVDYNTPDTSPGCMSFANDDDCVPVMSRLGLPFRDLPAGEQLFATMR